MTSDLSQQRGLADRPRALDHHDRFVPQQLLDHWCRPTRNQVCHGDRTPVSGESDVRDRDYRTIRGTLPAQFEALYPHTSRPGSQTNRAESECGPGPATAWIARHGHDQVRRIRRVRSSTARTWSAVSGLTSATAWMTSRCPRRTARVRLNGTCPSPIEAGQAWWRLRVVGRPKGEPSTPRCPWRL